MNILINKLLNNYNNFTQKELQILLRTLRDSKDEDTCVCLALDDFIDQNYKLSFDDIKQIFLGESDLSAFIRIKHNNNFRYFEIKIDPNEVLQNFKLLQPDELDKETGKIIFDNYDLWLESKFENDFWDPDNPYGYMFDVED